MISNFGVILLLKLNMCIDLSWISFLYFLLYFCNFFRECVLLILCCLEVVVILLLVPTVILSSVCCIYIYQKGIKEKKSYLKIIVSEILMLLISLDFNN